MLRGVLLAGTVALGAVACGVVTASASRAASFAFDDRLGSTTDFSIASGGLTATFSSASGPGTFAVAAPIGLYDYPVALGDYGAFEGDPLTITFSTPVIDRILIPFGIEESYATGPATLVARADTGQTVTFTTEFAALLSGAPEGSVSFMPTGPISSLTLMSMFGIAIASVDVAEPSSAVLLGAGCLGVLVLRRRAPVRAASRRGWRRSPSASARCG